jgi:3-deoxy-D-manno-octulosonate 8-phosphate phosphatase (KDO 8-P phosphatase)
MNITYVTKGGRDKATALRDFARRNALDLADVCVMGDDINDLEAMGIAGTAPSVN